MTWLMSGVAVYVALFVAYVAVRLTAIRIRRLLADRRFKRDLAAMYAAADDLILTNSLRRTVRGES